MGDSFSTKPKPKRMKFVFLETKTLNLYKVNAKKSMLIVFLKNTSILCCGLTLPLIKPTECIFVLCNETCCFESNVLY